ncbi:hypothetical protein [Trinickia sp.]|uniref:hypothetical protein n=1 Tax=Trinickia sp. TaxID=2571163 RepID=UPI003F7F531E
MSKPSFVVDIAENSGSNLDAHTPLALTSEERCHHHEIGLRMPLGIYNVSIARVCSKVLRLCHRLETYFDAGHTLQSLESVSDLLEEVIDYVELALYAAAEHVDDIDSIASGFFKSKTLRDKSSAYKQLHSSIKSHKRFVAAAANAIKHQQSRIRPYTQEYLHGTEYGCFHGYFFEGVAQGTVGPSKIFHQNQEIFSMTTLIWEILVFVLQCSRELSTFVNITSKQIVGPPREQKTRFAETVIAAARLPLYTFGEEHPFSRVALHITASDGKIDSLNSALYGSIGNQWSQNGQARFGQSILRFSGDGVSKSFRLASPGKVVLQNWTH